MKKILNYILGFLILLLILFFVKRFITPTIETLKNKKNYMHKTNNLYDDFYANIYDELVFSNEKNICEINEILNLTKKMPDKEVLDIGCGTGHHVNEFSKRGYSAIGIDMSKSMIKVAKNNFPKLDFKVMDTLSSINFDSNQFSLITCLYFTPYYIKNKELLFQNCMRWLKPKGYLAIHLVNKHKFNPMIPGGDPFIIISPQNYAKKRITESVVAFGKFDYKAIFNLDGNKGNFKEKFKFKDGKIRVNEHNFYMESQKTILEKAKNAGFKLKYTIDLGQCNYDHQFVHILQK